MTNVDKNKMIGIPFKLNGRNFEGCDCVGIVWLYYKYILGRLFPSTDGKRIFFRRKEKDLDRMRAVLNEIGYEVRFKDLVEGDVVILKMNRSIGALGVCINNEKLLHMDQVIGSCLTRLDYLKKIFLYGYRIKNEKIH